jgi:molybdopterin converting factor small subunit
MKLKVLFFGATADVIGERILEMDVHEGSTSRVAFEEILKAHPRLSTHKLLFSVNQEYASGRETIKDGDELAIFTAVSGG